jgi:hypothetical protein
MLLSTIVFSIVFAIGLALLLSYTFKRKGPGPANGLIFATTIIFLFSWVIGGWVAPLGPVHWDVPWLGYLIVALFVTLLLIILLPPRETKYQQLKRPATNDELFRKNAGADPVGISIGIFFWLMVTLLLAFAIIRIIYLV